MYEVKNNGLRFYRFGHLANCAGLRHGLFTRHGGSSVPPFDSLNVTMGVGDDPVRVRQNRRRILLTIGGTDMVFMRQVHGNRVHVVGGGAVSTGVPEADALVTAVPGPLLAVQVADCQPVLLFDPQCQVVAAVHSGWRGSVADILGRTVSVMVSRFHCRPGDILAGIGPSLGPCCAEFRNYQAELPESFRLYKNQRDYFDFWAISVDQLCRAGLLRKNIEVQGICTRCHPELFFSYRAEKTTGRLAAVIGLAPNHDLMT